MVESSSHAFSAEAELSEDVKRFYPKTAIMILFFLRKIKTHEEFVYIHTIIDTLDIPKSTVSSNLRILQRAGLIRKDYHIITSTKTPFLRVSLTARGLQLVGEIVSLALTEKEIESLSF